jgi:hypothetical protein
MLIESGNLDQPINQESEIEKRRAVMHYEKSQAKATNYEGIIGTVLLLPLLMNELFVDHLFNIY